MGVCSDNSIAPIGGATATTREGVPLCFSFLSKSALQCVTGMDPVEVPSRPVVYPALGQTKIASIGG